MIIVTLNKGREGYDFTVTDVKETLNNNTPLLSKVWVFLEFGNLLMNGKGKVVGWVKL